VTAVDNLGLSAAAGGSVNEGNQWERDMSSIKDRTMWLGLAVVLAAAAATAWLMTRSDEGRTARDADCLTADAFEETAVRLGPAIFEGSAISVDVIGDEVVCQNGWAFARAKASFDDSAYIILERRDGEWRWMADTYWQQLGEPDEACTRVPPMIAAAMGCAASFPTPSASPCESSPNRSPPVDLLSADWSGACVPGDFCGIDHSVQLVDGEGVGETSKYGTGYITLTDEVVEADLDGDGLPDVALEVWCTNGSGTAAGQLGHGYVVFTAARGDTDPVGTVSPRMTPPDVHVSLISRIEISTGRILVHELWYRDSDPTCCPSGTATTTWEYVEGELSPGAPNVTG
jgi:hypothetical protein